MVIFLHELDITETGSPIPLPRCCQSLEQFILIYVFFCDCICIQSSSALKRKDVELFFLEYQDLFSYNNSIGMPRVSFVLDPDIESLEHYITKRVETLSKNSSTANNIEKGKYVNNNAIKVAKSIDRIIKNHDITRRKHDINKIFKKLVFDLALEMEKGDELHRKCSKIITNYTTKNQFFQTFDMIDTLFRAGVDSHTVATIGTNIRNCYFVANAQAINQNYHDFNWKTTYANIHMFATIIGLTKIFNENWKLNVYAIEAIKNLESYLSLIDYYYNLLTSETKLQKMYNAHCQGNRNIDDLRFYDYSYTQKLCKLFNKDLKDIKSKCQIRTF